MRDWKALWWDDIEGRRELSSFLGGLGWGLLIATGITLSSVLAVVALVPLVLALLIRVHVMAEARRVFEKRFPHAR